MRKAARFCLALLFGSVCLAAPAAARTQAEATIRGFYATLLATMKEGHALGRSGRFARLAPVVARLFDVRAMAEFAIGPAWTALDAEGRQQAAEAFWRYISAIYADRFDRYSGEHLRVVGERPYQSQTIVETRILKASGEPVTIDYLLRRTGAGWQVSDVYLDGSISQLAELRSEFHRTVMQQGVAGLVASLNRKVDQLTHPVAKFSSNTPPSATPAGDGPGGRY